MPLPHTARVEQLSFDQIPFVYIIADLIYCEIYLQKLGLGHSSTYHLFQFFLLQKFNIVKFLYLDSPF